MAGGWRQLLRHTPTVDPPPLGLGGAAPHPKKVAVGQSHLQALLADRAVLADCQSMCHPLLVVREECLSLAFASGPILPLCEHSAPRSPPLNHDADTAVHGQIEPYGLTRNNGTTRPGRGRAAGGGWRGGRFMAIVRLPLTQRRSGAPSTGMFAARSGAPFGHRIRRTGPSAGCSGGRSDGTFKPLAENKQPVLRARRSVSMTRHLGHSGVAICCVSLG